MARLPLSLAGAAIDLCVPGSPPAKLAGRYGAFVRPDGPARWHLELRPGALPHGESMTGRVTLRDGVLRLDGRERHGFLDARTGTGEALLDPHLLVVDALVRVALALDLNARGGCLFHAAGLVVDGEAHLAPGRSGAGKTTLAGLAGDVLSDEICAVVPDGEAFRAMGTPWWEGRPGAAPLAAVWELDRDAERTRALGRAEALRHLCANLVVPTVEGAERTAFELCGRVAAAVPFGRLSFRLDTDVDALLGRGKVAA
jgi:hypothetical protein